MNILVTSANGDSALATIRILKQTSEHKIFAIDCSQYSSNLADQQFVVPYADDYNYIPTITRLVKEYKIDLIIPTIEEELLVLSLNLKMIGCQVILSPLSTLILCQDKLNTIKELKDLIPTPDIYKENIKFPAIIKPRSSRGSRGIVLIHYQEEIPHIEDTICQEYLPGEEYTVDLVCDKQGKPLVIVPRIRIKTKGGVSIIGKTVKDKKIIELVEKITSRIHFYGAVNVQFKKDINGIPKLLEINPRTSGGLPITYLSGVNIPLLIVKTAFLQKIKPEELQWKETLVYRYLTEKII